MSDEKSYVYGILGIIAIVAVVGIVLMVTGVSKTATYKAVPSEAVVGGEDENVGGQASYWDEDFNFGDGDKVCYGPEGCYGKEKRDCKSPCAWKDGSKHGECCATEFGSQSMCDMGNTERGCGAIPDCEWETGVDTCPEGGGGYWTE